MGWSERGIIGRIYALEDDKRKKWGRKEKKFALY